MSDGKRIVFAFVLIRKTAYSAQLPQGPESIPPPGKELVTVRLMSHIPENDILRRIEYIMEAYGKLDSAKA